MAIGILLMLVLGVVGLVGVAGLVLLVVGIIKRCTPMWVGGLIGVVLAGMAVLGGVAVGLYWAGHARSAAARHVAQRGPGAGGDYVRSGDGQATARIEGIEFTVIAPGSGRTGSSSRSSVGVLPGTSETRHEVTLGDVVIVVEGRDGRLTLSVNAADYGPVNRGDSVLINEAREVFINGQRRLP